MNKLDMLLKLKFFLFLLGLWLSFFGCSRSDDTAIRKTLEEIKAKAEALDWQGVMDYISKEYKDDSGHNRAIIGILVKRAFEGVQTLEVDYKISGISIAGDEATVSLEIVTRAYRGNQVFYPFGSDRLPEYPTVFLKKEGLSNWKIVKVEGVKGSSDIGF